MADEIDPSLPDAPVEPKVEPDWLTQPVDAEQPPRLSFPVVGIGASAGGLKAISAFLDAMPADAGMAFVIIQHLPPDHESMMAEILGRRTAMAVLQVEDGIKVEPNHVYVIRPGNVLLIRDGRLYFGPRLDSPKAANRPIDDFFRSLAEEQRERAIAIIMSGMGSNGTAGAQAIKEVGGLCVAQDPDTAEFASMPRHLIDAGYADYIAHPADLPEVLLNYAQTQYASGGREEDAERVLEREQQHLREILAILRTRTRHDYSGYKKPTLLRRVQRRMGLCRLATMADYTRLLRQSPTEVTTLGDDLLIHVTGFFRDPEAWDALYNRVVVPLVAARESGGTVRAWVAACSTGEEAYSLAILLSEEADRANKRLDIKVFATDPAERSLAHARAGIYPGGIESEVSPERLRQFFVKEDEMYRVRQDLRDRVVFAPQNVLQDPPFSRLDIVSCRNLLIYLEHQVQQRVLALLHFGLRDGGALFLGTSETITGAEELFESIDKKSRIYRRVGPTRHGAIDFPMPRLPHSEERPSLPIAPPALLASGRRPLLAELTRQTLLDAHTPPAVTVGRDYNILYYHGDTRPFLQQLSGEPTRDLMLLAKDGIRGAVRVALRRAVATAERASAHDGWVDTNGDRRLRVHVVVSPIAGGEDAAASDFFVVSFEERGEVAPPALPVGPSEGVTIDEMRRLRGELQSTIEELQTSNEELKASNEEVMSINEELQSSNEELETSKEEMQALNEELRTVNSQLRAKMEEHQETNSDLTSLLTSTDIAVLFLDTTLRIRRFTPAVRGLLDLIPTDVGRPLAALARRFDDPELDADCQKVLDSLAPISCEVTGENGRHYARRVLPYRTTDNRIGGVVVTFVDVTDRKLAEQALAAEKEYAESIVLTLHEPLLVLNPDLTINSVNPAFYAHFQVDPAETIGRKVYQLGNGQWDIPALRTLLEDVLPSNYVFNEYEMTHDFERLGRRVMLLNGRRLKHVQLILLGIRDITARKRAEEALAAELQAMTLLQELSERLLTAADLPAAMGEVLDAAIALHSADFGTVQIYDSKQDHMLFTAVRGFDASILAAVSPIDRDFHSSCAAALRTGERVLVPDILADPRFAAHRPAAAALAYRAAFGFPLTTRRGEFLGVLSVHFREQRDPTDRDLRQADLYTPTAAHLIERQQAEDALRTSEQWLRLGLAAARMGTWTLDLVTNAQTRDGNLNRLLGLDPVDSAQPFEQFLTHIHPDDRTIVEEAFALSSRGGQPLAVEFRVVWADGTTRWLRDQGDVFGAPAGGQYLAGACVDITERREAEEALRQSEERIRRIVESATDYGILTLAPDRTVMSWSPGAEATFRYTAEEIVGQSGDLLFTPEDRAAAAPQAEADEASRTGRAADERWHIRKDDTRFFASGVMTLLRDGAGYVKVLRDLTERKRWEDELRDARDHLEARVKERTAEFEAARDALQAEMTRRRELNRRLATAQEDERRRISRDLHDTVGQLIAGLSLAFKAIESSSKLPPVTAAKLTAAQELADHLGKEVHDLAIRLRPTALDDIGLAAAVTELVSEWSQRSTISADIEIVGLDHDRLTPEVETVLYRTVQEALTNVAKHAQATQVNVVVTRDAQSVTAIIEDNGVGFDPKATPRGRLGLMGMRERVTLIGGQLEVESTPDGTVILARVPAIREGSA